MDRQLSPHFNEKEFETDGPLPEECVPVVTEFCNLVLEPIRNAFGVFVLTSTRRTSEANAEAHGQSNSEHLYTPDICAVDGLNPTVPARVIFDWARNNPMLPYHQLILEHGKEGTSIIHISMNRKMPGVRSVLEGATHNSEKYAKVDHVDFINPNNHDAVQDASAG